ncbi:MAG: High-affinity zinc uptake system ATP-binding protein ZnuC [Chlamydiae bacterium]|nr:High-affinity zinc uptake system ATP-binding protein ZnuC [Chlamydiota bacterium]
MTISVENLFFSYDKRAVILENLNFSVKKGQFIGIFGPNGGGKTTLLQLLLGLRQPTTGNISILGKGPSQASSRIGYVPQVRRYDRQFPISVIEVVLQGCLATHKGWGNFSKDAKDKALASLKKVGLDGHADKAFGTLSGGQIQRTLIARALASNPEILLLDEATVGIDPDALKEIFRFLVGLRGQITILLVTHELQAIAKDMNHLLCINKELTTYSPEEVCEHFAMGLYHPTLMKREKKRD